MSKPIPQIPNQTPHRVYPPVPVVINGVTRMLRLTWAAIRAIRDQTRNDKRPQGINILVGVDPKTVDDLADLPIIFAELLRHEDSFITADEVEEMLLVGMDVLLPALFLALGSDMQQVIEACAQAEEGESKTAAPLAPTKARKTRSRAPGR